MTARGQPSVKKGDTTMKTIDSHCHFLDPQAIRYCWMTPDMPLARRLMPEDLLPLQQQHGIESTILVEAADSYEENRFMFELADRHDAIVGVVAWIDMEASDFRQRLSRCQEHPKFVGIRVMIEAIPDDQWMLRPAVQGSFGVLEENDICFDFLVRPGHLPHVIKVLETFPKLRAVIDHIAKPPIRRGALQPWKDLMAEVASCENVHCKVSGMITEADLDTWRPEDLSPFIEHVLAVFGVERLMFGSDWPVCLLAGSFGDVVAALRQNLEDLPDRRIAQVFGETAQRFYRISRSGISP